MTFAEFLKLREETSTSDQGLMGFTTKPRSRKPSDRQPFADLLSPVAGDKGGSGGAPGAPQGPVMGASSMFKMKKI